MFEDSVVTNDIDYPLISDELIKALKKTYPNEMPMKYIDDYEQGILVGIQTVINKLIFEKECNEDKNLEKN
jgi:hypothetical protein